MKKRNCLEIHILKYSSVQVHEKLDNKFPHFFLFRAILNYLAYLIYLYDISI